MAVYTFTQGEKLTANLANTYMANGGLVYVAGTTVTSSSAYVEILNCFSASYDNYRIVINGVQATANAGMAFYLGTSGTSGLYYGTVYYDQYSGSTGVARVNGGNFVFVGLTDSAGASGGYSFDLNQPYLSRQKTMHGSFDGRNYAGWSGGLIASSSSFTGIRFLSDVGNILSGTFRVYGYRQA